MVKEIELSKVRYHWASYVARGGIDEPKESDIVGSLDYGGIEHWTLFLKNARAYLAKYPKDRYMIESFVPLKTVKLLVGE